jgi:membrane protease YdiL (CAAX protease family)
MMSDAQATPVQNYLEWSDRGKSTFWRYILGLMVILSFWQMPAELLKNFLPGRHGVVGSMAILVVPFVFAFISVPLTARWVLKRPWYSVALPSLPPRLGDLGIGFLLQIVVLTALTLAFLPVTHLHYRGFDAVSGLGTLLPFLLLAVVGLFFQTAFEEMYFRGYVEQTMRRVSKSLFVFLVLPALFFGFRHLGNIDAFGTSFSATLPYFFFAVSLGWVAYRTGSLMIAFGLHWANNLFVALVVVTSGDVVPSLAPWVQQQPTLQQAVLFNGAQAILVVAVVEWIVRWRERKAVAPTPGPELAEA